jgi:hypothetical protein
MIDNREWHVIAPFGEQLEQPKNRGFQGKNLLPFGHNKDRISPVALLTV